MDVVSWIVCYSLSGIVITRWEAASVGFSLLICYKTRPGVRISWADTCLAACLDKAKETHQKKLAIIYCWCAAIGKPRVVIGVGNGNPRLYRRADCDTIRGV